MTHTATPCIGSAKGLVHSAALRLLPHELFFFLCFFKILLIIFISSTIQAAFCFSQMIRIHLIRNIITYLLQVNDGSVVENIILFEPARNVSHVPLMQSCVDCHRNQVPIPRPISCLCLPNLKTYSYYLVVLLEKSDSKKCVHDSVWHQPPCLSLSLTLGSRLHLLSLMLLYFRLVLSWILQERRYNKTLAQP